MWLGWISRLRTLVKLLTLLAMTVVSSEGWTGPGSVPGSLTWSKDRLSSSVLWGGGTYSPLVVL